MNLKYQQIAPTLLLIAMLAGCGAGSDKPAAGGPGGAMPPPEVDVVTVTQGSATLTQDLPGRLQAYRTAEVRARVEGVVEKRLFAEGSDVAAGASLFKISSRTYQANAEAARADLAIARQTVARYQPLLEVKAVSQQEYDLAAAKVKQAEAALARAEEDLENASVPAAISGHIGRALVTEGAFVGKGEATLLATIEQLDPIYVNFTQSGGDLLRLKQAIRSGKLKNAGTVKVELLQEDGSVYPLAGKVFFTGMSVDPATGAVAMRAEFPNPQHELLPGMFVHLRFPEALAEGVIRLPQRAVMAGPQGQFVMLVGADGKATPQPVKTSGMAAEDFIIASGLKGGEQVIVNGLQKARPGTVVKPVPWDPAAPLIAAPPAKPADAAAKADSGKK
ncbi:MAG: efflux RND transporter periplasmic adaptor subunit [Gallionella sp.]|nr:efflux RND transporter periplasmic adaptor subunit [Gallionella sp.]MDD4945429.1 efflux RND transporter periplasmic adaptor subunit [Gallionella sp.]MDD5612184.1 efflux RND transporter periplasmic adaptor subunit [Gallionella sp.]